MLPVYTNADILKCLGRISSEKGIHLTPTHKAFFIALYSFFDKQSMFDSEKGMYYIQYSCRELANLLQFSYKMVCLSFQLLDDCGVLIRVDSPKTFRHLPNGEYLLNKPKVTFLDLELLKKFM